MTVGLIIVTIITVYLALAAAAAPKLMRLIYQEKMAVQEQNVIRYERDLAAYNADRTGKTMLPYRVGDVSSMNAREDARYEGFWWSLVWPFSLAFHALGATAFAQEIAAERAAENAKIIAKYEKLQADTFDKELASANPPTNLIHRLTRKAHK